MKCMNEIMILDPEELAAVTEITDLYRLVAERVLGEVTEDTSYDCRKLTVSESVYNSIKGKYKCHMKFAVEWMGFGPRIDYSLCGNAVVAEEGFC